MKDLKQLQIIALLCLIIIFATSCSKFSDNLTSVPKDATVVMSIDFRSLAEKGKFDELLETKIYELFNEEIEAESNTLGDLFNEIFKNPLRTGIDFRKDITTFFVASSNNEQYIGISADIINEKKITELVEKLSDELRLELNIEKINKYQYVQIPNSSYSQNPIFAWDKKKLLILIPQHHSDDMDDNLSDYVEELMFLNRKDAITANKDFKKFYNNKKDISIWASTNILDDILSKRKRKEISSNLDYDLDNNFIHAFLDFRKSEISLLFNFSYNEDITEKIIKQDLYEKNIQKDILSYLPIEKYIVAGLSFNPEVLYEIIDNVNFDIIKMQFKNEIGISLKDVFANFNGDFVFSLSDIETLQIERITKKRVFKEGYYDENKTYYPDEYIYVDSVYTENRTFPIMTLCATIESDEIIKKFIDIIPETNIEKLNNYYKLSLDGLIVYFGMNNNILSISTGDDIIKKSVNEGFGEQSLKNSNISNTLVASYFYAYANLNFEDYSPEITEIIEKQTSKSKFSTFNKLTKNYSHFTIQTDNPKSLELTLHLKSDTENSLYAIIKNIDNNFEDIIN